MESSLAQSTERFVYVGYQFWRIGLGDKEKSSKEVIEERAKQMAKVVCICKGINYKMLIARWAQDQAAAKVSAVARVSRFC